MLAVVASFGQQMVHGICRVPWRTCRLPAIGGASLSCVHVIERGTRLKLLRVTFTHETESYAHLRTSFQISRLVYFALDDEIFRRSDFDSGHKIHRLWRRDVIIIRVRYTVLAPGSFCPPNASH
jgi:hypothetical protein